MGNREIKFRAWHDNKMHEVVCLWFGQSGHVCVQKGDEVDTLFRDYILMQFTGLKDKNGVEIYEGDIVKGKVADVIHAQDTYKIKTEFINSLIYWDKSECGFYTDFNGLWLQDSEKVLEVIGNIYEQPHLLQQ